MTVNIWWSYDKDSAFDLFNARFQYNCSLLLLMVSGFCDVVASPVGFWRRLICLALAPHFEVGNETAKNRAQMEARCTQFPDFATQ